MLIKSECQDCYNLERALRRAYECMSDLKARIEELEIRFDAANHDRFVLMQERDVARARIEELKKQSAQLRAHLGDMDKALDG